MKTLKLVSLFALALAIVSCGTASKKQKKNAEEPITHVQMADGIYEVNTDNSVVNWVGSKPTEDHYGTLMLSSGEVTVAEKNIASVSAIIDLNTITCSDIENEKWNKKLVAHLKNEDFFDVPNHPTASFSSTSIEDKDGKITVTGNLTIKGISKPVSFGITVEKSGESTAIVSEEIIFDRTEFDIKYNSKKFFDIEKLKDKLIKDEIKIQFNLVLAAQ